MDIMTGKSIMRKKGAVVSFSKLQPNSELYKKFYMALMIFAIVFLVYIIFIQKWFFDGEDYFILYRVSLIKNFKDFTELFLCGKATSITPDALGCDLPLQQVPSFLSRVYRPLTYAIHFFQYNLFGLSAWFHYVSIVFFHAVITSLLFYCLAFFITYPMAFLCSLFFAFHPMLDSWFGKIDLQQHQIHLLFALCTIIAFKKYIDTQNKHFYMLSGLCFFLCILTRETFIILPFIMFMALRLFPETGGQKINTLSIQVKLMLGFCLIAVLYALLRNIACPLTLNSKIDYIRNVFSFDFFYNIFLMNLYPRSAFIFFQGPCKIFLFRSLKVIFFLVFITLFFTNSKKRVVLFFLLCMTLLYWPMFVTPYDGYRFFYEGCPFYVAAVGSLINFSSLKNYFVVRCIGAILLVILIFINATFTIFGMQKSASIREPTHMALQKLKAQDSFLKEYPILIFDNLESKVIDLALIHAMYLCGITGSNVQYCISQFNLHAKNANISEQIRITPFSDGIRLTSLDKRSVWFSHKKNNDSVFFIKQITIHGQDNENNIFDFSIVFERKYFKLPMIVLLWSEKDDCFEKFYVDKVLINDSDSF